MPKFGHPHQCGLARPLPHTLLGFLLVRTSAGVLCYCLPSGQSPPLRKDEVMTVAGCHHARARRRGGGSDSSDISPLTMWQERQQEQWQNHGHISCPPAHLEQERSGGCDSGMDPPSRKEEVGAAWPNPSQVGGSRNLLPIVLSQSLAAALLLHLPSPLTAPWYWYTKLLCHLLTIPRKMPRPIHAKTYIKQLHSYLPPV